MEEKQKRDVTLSLWEKGNVPFLPFLQRPLTAEVRRGAKQKLTAADIDALVNAATPSRARCWLPRGRPQDEQPLCLVRGSSPTRHRSRCAGTTARGPWVLKRIHEAACSRGASVPPPAASYRLRVNYRDGHASRSTTPTTSPRSLSDFDLNLFGEGNHIQHLLQLGAHPVTLDGLRAALRGVGAERRTGASSAPSTLERRPTPCRCAAPRHLGDLHPGARPRTSNKY